MIQSDSQGFLVGPAAAEYMRRLARSNDSILAEVRALRRELRPVASTAKVDAKAKARTAAVAKPRMVDATAKVAAVAATATVRRIVQLPARNAKGQFVSAKPAPPIRAVTLPGRNGQGRFVSAGGGGAATPGSRPSASPQPKDLPIPSAPAEPSLPRSAGSGFRRQALMGVIGQGAEYDASLAAGREVTGLLKPAYDFVRGDPQARREKREERRAEARQRRSEAWYKRLLKALGGEHPQQETRKGGGILGMLASLLLPLVSMLMAPFKLLGRLPGLGGGMKLPGILAGGRIGRFGRLLARAKIPIIGTALSALFYGADAIGDELNPTLSDSQRRSARFQNGGRAVGGIGGAVIGGILGSVGGPLGAAVGAWLGGIGGEMLGRQFGKWTQSLIDADVPGMLARAWDAVVNWGRAKLGLPPIPASRAAASGSYASRVGGFESGNDYGNTAQVDAFMAGTPGATTASGKYQMLDGTFADVVARKGAGNAALAGLQPLAAAYLADSRGAKAKRLDSKYAPLFAGKLDPAAAEASMSIFTDENRAKLAAVGITDPTDAQLYSVHLTGNTGLAEAMQKNAGAAIGSAASGISADQIASNRGLFAGVQTVGDLRAKLDKKIGSASGLASAAAPAIATAPKIADATKGGNGTQVQVIPVPVQSVAQNVADRGIAHVATGGLGNTI